MTQVTYREPRRPVPKQSWIQRRRERRGMLAESWRMRWAGRRVPTAELPVMLDGGPGGAGERGDAISPRRQGASSAFDALGGQRAPSVFVMVLTAVASSLAVLAALAGWQAWSGRSDPPVDDLIPLLISATEQADGPIEPGDSSGASNVDVDAAEEPLSADQISALDAVEGPPTHAVVPDVPVVIVVHISGAVELPGVVQLVAGGRVFEAVAAAGGATAEADLERVNLAAPLVDGERVHVPAAGEDHAPELVPTQRPSPSAGSGSQREAVAESDRELVVVDLNVASAVELEALPGIGPATAGAIVRTRDERGPFRSVDELLEVPGIGAAKLALMLPLVTVAVHG